MVKLNAQDASLLLLESSGAPMQIGFLLTFKLPPRAPVHAMQTLHARLARLPVEVEPFNLRLRDKHGLGRLRPEWETVDAVDLEYHLRHEALPWPGGERELGLVISRLHSEPLEHSRPLWECTLIEGLKPDRFALYLKFHHALADGAWMMQCITQSLAESRRGISLPPWAAPTVAAPKPMQAADDDWRHFFEKLLGGLTKPRSARKGESLVPHGPRCVLNGSTTARRRFATQDLDLPRFRAVAQAAAATVNDVLIAVCSGALRRYLREFDRIPPEPLMASIPVALPRVAGQTIGNSVAAVHVPIATHLDDPGERLLAIRDATRAAKEGFNRLPATLNRAINSVGMLAITALPKPQKSAPDKAAFTNLTISNVPGPKQRLYFYGAELEGMYPVSVLVGDHRLNITVLGYHEHLHFGLTACPDTLPSVQKFAVALPGALRELEVEFGLARRSRAKAAAAP